MHHPEVCKKAERLMLHSAEIQFAHPYSGQQMRCKAPSGFASLHGDLYSVNMQHSLFTSEPVVYVMEGM